MLPGGEERREFQRLKLNPPLDGALASSPVSIVEIGVLGARVQHPDSFTDKQVDLLFTHDGAEIALRCEVVRTYAPRAGETGMQTGVRFVAAMDGSGDKLRDMLAQMVRREFAVRRRVPTLSTSSDFIVDGDKTVRGKDAMFLCYRLEGSIWRKRRVFLPEQPAVGFTVATAVDTDELHRLCRVYAASDEEGRRLIRLFAELSVSDALQIPPAS
jgi:hypothetical protein